MDGESGTLFKSVVMCAVEARRGTFHWLNPENEASTEYSKRTIKKVRLVTLSPCPFKKTQGFKKANS